MIDSEAVVSRERPAGQVAVLDQDLLQGRRRADYQPGETLVQRDLAASLRLIAEQGPEALYRGPIGQKVVAAVARAGGHLTIADLRGY